MSVYTGVRMTINGVLNEKIDVNFNTVDGGIGLVFRDGVATETDVAITYAAAAQLAHALQTALGMRRSAKAKARA